MKNDRPIDDPNLRDGIREIQEIMERRGLAGAAMLVGPTEAAFTYGMHAPWSAIRPDPNLDLGFRVRANSSLDGVEITKDRVLGAAHTICQLSDFGEQTTAWMEDLKIMLRRVGINFDHVPFGGRPLQHLTNRSPDGR